MEFPITNISLKLKKADGAKFYALIDMMKTYWQMELDEGNQECQIFITPDGKFSPTRVLHVNFNDTAHLYASLIANMSL